MEGFIDFQCNFTTAHALIALSRKNFLKTSILFFILVRPIRRAIIHSAIREWEEFTCIRFKERRYEKDYIEFFVGKG